jgi:pantoate--beta-alanine ligase
VLTVVAKLFNLVRPDIAVFGRKDAQQCLVIRQMVEDLKMPVRLVDGETIRETDGLAMSSRNRYLDSDQRQRALCLSRALRSAEFLLRSGVRETETLEKEMLSVLEEADQVEYAEVRQVPDLERPSLVQGTTLLAVAARVGPARLIDNSVLDITETGITPGWLLGPGKE